MQSLNTRRPILFLILVATLLACKAAGPSSQPPASPQALEVTPPTLAAIPTAVAISSPEPSAVPTTQTPKEAPLETPAATPERAFPTLPSAQPGPENLDLATLPQDPTISDFTESYDSRMSWQDAQDADQEATTLYTYRKQTVPEDAWYANLEDNNPFMSSKIETFVVSQNFYTLSQDLGCLKPGSDRVPSYDPQDAFRSLIKALTGQVKLTQAGVQLGDQVADMYTLQAANLLPDAQIVVQADQADEKGETTLSSSFTFPLLSQGGVLEEATLYLARQGGYVARVELTFSKTASEQDAPFAKPGSEMINTLVYDVIPASAQDAPVALPADCASLTGGSGGNSGGSGSTSLVIADIPRLDNASDLVEVSDVLTYSSTVTLQEAVDFYKTKLAEQGWEVSDETVMSNLASLSFARGEQTLTLQIVETNGKLMLTITLE